MSDDQVLIAIRNNKIWAQVFLAEGDEWLFEEAHIYHREASGIPIARVIPANKIFPNRHSAVDAGRNEVIKWVAGEGEDLANREICFDFVFEKRASV